VTREVDVSSGLLQTPYCPRNLVTSEFYISGTEPTRDCDKHGPYANPGLTPIDTSPIPPTPPVSGGVRGPITAAPPPIQPGYEPMRGQQRRAPTVFDTTTRRDTARRTTVFDTTRRPQRVVTRPRTDTIPSPARPPVPNPR
jgi:hypothetical protein